MYKYYIINITIDRPLCILNGANTKAMEFDTKEEATAYIAQADDIPNKKELVVMTWAEHLKRLEQFKPNL